MNRRDFLQSTSLALARLTLAKTGLSFAENPPSDGWRTFEVTTRAEVLKPAGTTTVWLPTALIQNTPFQRTTSNRFSADGGKAKMVESKQQNLGIVVATFPSGVRPVLILTSQVALKNYTIDLSNPGPARPLQPAELNYYLQPHKNIPTDGIVKAKATEITKGANTDIEKARAIYEWIVDNTFRDPKVRGCGRGDISVLLNTGYLGGKCADFTRVKSSSTRRIWDSCGEVRTGLQESGCVLRENHEGPALPGRSVLSAIRLGTRRSRRRAESSSGRATREPCVER